MKKIYFLLLFVLSSGIYYSQCSATVNDCDGDGILNTSDLDADNDGILNEAENTCTLPSGSGVSQTAPHLFWDVNSSAFPGTLESNALSPNVITSLSGVTFGSGLAGSLKVNSRWQINSINSASVSEAKANSDYIQFSIAVNSAGNKVFDLKEWVTYGNSTAVNLQNLSVEIADNAAFTNPVILFTGANPASTTGAFQKFNLNSPYRLQKGNTYYVRVFVYGSAATVYFDSFGFNAQCWSDTDGDTVPDYQDLDSDGDGCFDAIEGSENVQQSQINAQGRITGAVDSDGMPQLVNTGGLADTGNNQGQGVNNSVNNSVNDCRDTDGDGIIDIYDLDDDNDGITDADECGPALNTLETGGSFATTSTYRDFTIPPNPPLTGYSYASDGTIEGEGEYVITSAANSNNIHSQHWKNLYGHTTGSSTDAYLAVNGSTSTATFYRQNLVPLQANTLYRVSLWAINAITVTAPFNNAPANLRVRVFRNSDDVVVADYSTGNMYARVAPAGTVISPVYWREAAGTFNSGNETSFRIEVSNITISASDNDFAIDDITIRPALCQDSDNDGIPNSLELDSDADGCPDAIEGSANVIYPNLNPNTSISGNVNTGGVPVFLPGGQGIGDSWNSSINMCVCYKPGLTSGGPVLDAKHGITALNRAGADNGNWPMSRKGAWTVLEAKTKGFVPNRLTQTQISQIPTANLVEGMMVYNISADCLQIYIGCSSAGWKCLSEQQSCPDVN
ncbi:hypothetical protein [Chryseobacterium caseinilyticum]|uniref:MAM domain-containing protein n=1 Tax=Chryseobacterium caseinilyticum TaxID=2771428 RepID=A0ABR8Z6J8_9FLAO|nr:hypothetical protein [Chryseobacterium caseinilyticum]MBD8080919.1 hypothetical protein [Chryseobacterium caseinilyticum]